jgi:hypothetical protein
VHTPVVRPAADDNPERLRLDRDVTAEIALFAVLALQVPGRPPIDAVAMADDRAAGLDPERVDEADDVPVVGVREEVVVAGGRVAAVVLHVVEAVDVAMAHAGVRADEGLGGRGKGQRQAKAGEGAGAGDSHDPTLTRRLAPVKTRPTGSAKIGT